MRVTKKNGVNVTNIYHYLKSFLTGNWYPVPLRLYLSQKAPPDSYSDRRTENDQENPCNLTQFHVGGTLNEICTKLPFRDLRDLQAPTCFVRHHGPRLLDVSHISYEQSRFSTSYMEMCALIVLASQSSKSSSMKRRALSSTALRVWWGSPFAVPLPTKLYLGPVTFLNTT